MNFCRNILHSLGNSPFPGYELKIGELCSLPALSTNDSSARALSIPTGCIPLCVKVEPEFRANSGNGETPNLYIVIYDNNNKYYYYAWRNSSGWVSGGSKTQYLCPIGAYDGDVEAASAIKTIYARAYNGAGWAYSDYKYGKISVTMWLEKKSGGGSLYCKLFKNPFVKGFSACCRSGKRWRSMNFCRNILPASGGVKRLFLFKDGDQCTSVTGGWINTVVGNGGSYSASISETLYIGGSGNGTKYFQPAKNLPDDVLKKYDYVFFEFRARSYDSDNGGNCLFSGGFEYAVNNKWNRDKTRILALPLTSLLINFGLSMGGHSTSYMWVSKVWLEKVGA